MARNLLIKDLEIVTSNKRRCRRHPGEIPYPITYSNQMADFDIWDHMFLTSYFRSLAMHQFPRPPSRVLDIGCGTGYWVIEAAKQWKDSKIYGFDAAKIQPRLEEVEHYKPLARCIEWVHGNFLDGLPFRSDYFDFVRIAGLGLAIPEDEWQAVLEDIHRVMKPGAVLEIIEEDLLFPCPSALLQSPPPLSSPSSSTVHLPSFELHKSKSTMFYERSSTSPERKSSLTSSSVRDNARAPSRITSFLPSFSISGQSSTSTLIPPSSSSTDTSSETEHPQDHTRLKMAWEAMLETRFLSPNLLSVLPFYLTTSSFVETKVHSSLVIPLPPNSGNISSLKTCRSMGSLRNKSERSIADTLFDFSPIFSPLSFKTDGVSFRSSVSSLHHPSGPRWGTMHLAKTVSTIRGCKEALWDEYKKLFSADALTLLSRTAPDEDFLSQPHRHVVRRAFEVDWKNWECDMVDRMGMQNNLLTHLGWVPTMPDAERDRPDWRTWRGKLDRMSWSDTSSGHLITGYNPDDSCRSLRIFTGFKA